MEILFLGTSSGTPTKERNVSGVALLVESGRHWYLIDCGEATQHQLLHTSLSLNRLSAVFITHIHGDHCYGLPGLLASAAMSGRTQPLVVVAPESIQTWIQTTQTLTSLQLPFDLQFFGVETLTTWQGHQVAVDALCLSHRVPSFAYRFTETQRTAKLNTAKLLADDIPPGPLWGRLKHGQDVQHGENIYYSRDYLHFPHDARRIIVCGDNDRPELLREAIVGVQVLVHEATYTQDVAAKVGPGVQHSSAEVVAVFAESVKVPNLILTHFSPRYRYKSNRSPSIADIRKEAEDHYKGRLFLADDFARYRLNEAGTLARVD